MGSEWTNQAAVTISQCLSVNNIQRGEVWLEVPDEAEQFAAIAGIEGTISYNSSPEDVMVFSDNSVKH